MILFSSGRILHTGSEVRPLLLTNRKVLDDPWLPSESRESLQSHFRILPRDFFFKLSRSCYHISEKATGVYGKREREWIPQTRPLERC